MPWCSFFSISFSFCLGATKHLYNWLCRSVCWLVTHSFDDPHVAPNWPTSVLGLVCMIRGSPGHFVTSVFNWIVDIYLTMGDLIGVFFRSSAIEILLHHSRIRNIPVYKFKIGLTGCWHAVKPHNNISKSNGNQPITDLKT